MKYTWPTYSHPCHYLWPHAVLVLQGKILGELVFADDKGQAAQKAAKKFDDFSISHYIAKCK